MRSWLSTHAAVVVVLVHLDVGQPEHVVRRPAVADHALGAAGVVPGLLRSPPTLVLAVAVPSPATERPPRSARRSSVGVADPLALLLGEEARFDPVPRRGVARLRTSRANDFTSTVSSGKFQPRLVVKSIRMSSPGLAEWRCTAPCGAVGPERRIDRIRNRRPAASAWSLTLANRPLSLSVLGNWRGRFCRRRRLQIVVAALRRRRDGRRRAARRACRAEAA